MLTSAGGGGGGGYRWDQGWFLWPLPTSGTLTFICEWPLLEVPETRAEVSADPLVEAAGGAVELWADERPPWSPGEGVWTQA